MAGVLYQQIGGKGMFLTASIAAFIFSIVIGLCQFLIQRTHNKGVDIHSRSQGKFVSRHPIEELNALDLELW